MSSFSFDKFFRPSDHQGSSDASSDRDEDRKAGEYELQQSAGDGASSGAGDMPPVLGVTTEQGEEDVKEGWNEDAVFAELTSLFETAESESDEPRDKGATVSANGPAEDRPPKSDDTPDAQDDGGRLGWLVDFVNEGPGEDGADSPQELQQTAEEDRGDSSEQLELSDLDAVVLALLQREAVTMNQVGQALRHHKESGEDAPLWHFLASVEGVDRGMVLAEAASQDEIPSAGITEEKPTTVFLHTVFNVFPPAVRQQLVELELVPYKFVLDEEVVQQRMIVATYDPLRPDVVRFADEFNLEVELRYAPEHVVKARIAGVQQVSDAEAKADEKSGAARAAEEPPAPAGEPDDQVSEVAPQVDTLEPEDDVELAFEEPAESEHQMILREDNPLAENEEHDPPMKAEDARDPLIAEPVEPEVEEPEPTPSAQANVDVNVDLTIENHIAAASEAKTESARQEVEPAQREGANRPAEEAAEPVPEEQETVAAAADEGEQAEAPEPDAGGILEEEELDEDYQTAIEAVRGEDRVVARLLREKIVSPDQVNHARAQKEKSGTEETLWRVVAGIGTTDREAVYASAARVYGFAAADLESHPTDPDFARSVVERFGEEHQDRLLELGVMPYESKVNRKAGTVQLAFITHDPTRQDVHRLMHELDIDRFELRYAPEEVVGDLIAAAFPKKNEFLERMRDGGEAMDLGLSHDDDGGLVDEEALEAEMNRSKLINLFEATLVEGVREGASDIHIYPNADKKVEIHFRVDGRLKHWHTEDKVHPESMLAVIKDNAMNVDRFERDAAQDGFIQRKIDNALIRFRVSVLPIANASQEIRSESIVIRILDDRKVITDLTQLGLLDTALERFDKAIRQPHGMVILTGPTGSGKSTTLVASLHQVVTPEVNVLTVEDPVEYIIPGVRQIKLNNKLTLDGALRSILRHDPDIVMVGEMRDRHTAELAIKLANTGHLTFSTLHTNDAPSAISRLYKMGIEPFLIAYAINLVVAQRLIRRLCPTCKQVDPDPDPVLLKKLGFSEEEINNYDIYMPGDDSKCPDCAGMGYKGRRAISEALYFSRKIRHMIVEAEDMIDEGAIRDLAVQEGMLTLQHSAREVVKMGDTSIREMIRVVASET